MSKKILWGFTAALTLLLISMFIYVSAYTIAKNVLYDEIYSPPKSACAKGEACKGIKQDLMLSSIETERKLLKHSQETYDFFVRTLTFLLTIWSLTITIAGFLGIKEVKKNLNDKLMEIVEGAKIENRRFSQDILEKPVTSLRMDVLRLEDKVGLLVAINNLKYKSTNLGGNPNPPPEENLFGN